MCDEMPQDEVAAVSHATRTSLDTSGAWSEMEFDQEHWARRRLKGGYTISRHLNASRDMGEALGLCSPLRDVHLPVPFSQLASSPLTPAASG